MRAHTAAIVIVPAGVVLFTLLPFLPGSYDPLAVPLSMMARVAGFVGLLFAPVGALWMASVYSRALAATPHACAVAALIVSSLVWTAVSLAAFAMGSPSLALICLGTGVYAFVRVTLRLRSQTGAPTPTATTALALLVLPIAVFLVQRAALEPAVEFSRSRVISNSARLITDIERYRTTRGHYPLSLLSVHKDYSPGMMGVERFHYEPSGKAFNLLFEQPPSSLGTREIVVYNPRGEQTATSHALDLLEFTPDRLELARGYFAVHDVPHTHWKYFWFD